MLTEIDKAVLAHIVEDPDGWVTHALATVGVDAVLAKCRKPQYVAAYLAAKAQPGYLPRHQRPREDHVTPGMVKFIQDLRAKDLPVAEDDRPRGKPVSDETCNAVAAAVEAKLAQQERINKLFS